MIKDNLVTSINNQLVTDTLIIAKGIGVEHVSIMTMVRKYEKDINELGTCRFQIDKFKTGGRSGEKAILSEDQTIFLITLMRNSKIVVEFKKKLVQEFCRQRELLAQIVSHQQNAQWLERRNAGKEVRRTETDSIKDFIDYATEQGSKNAQMYYANISTMENKALFVLEQKFPNLRDALDFKQLATIQCADSIVSKALSDGMTNKMHYRDIYKMAKERVESFAEIHGKSLIPQLRYDLLEVKN